MQYQFAGLGRRLAALAIDFLLFCAVFFPVTRLVKGTWLMRAADHRWNYRYFVTDPLCLAFLAVIFVYFVVFEAYAGATFGKYLLGMRVATAGGGVIGFKQSLVRNALRLVDGLPAFNILGVVLILTSSEKARLGDRVACTRVVLAQPHAATRSATMPHCSSRDHKEN